jgi:hypothetical protein
MDNDTKTAIAFCTLVIFVIGGVYSCERETTKRRKMDNDSIIQCVQSGQDALKCREAVKP